MKNGRKIAFYKVSLYFLSLSSFLTPELVVSEIREAVDWFYFGHVAECYFFFAASDSTLPWSRTVPTRKLGVASSKVTSKFTA